MVAGQSYHPSGVTGATGSFSSVTTTSDSTFNGVLVGLGGGSQSTNTVVGNNTLTSNTTGTNNTSIGNSSMNDLQTGSNNTAIGSNSGITNLVNGEYNTLLGANTNVASDPLSYSTAVGYNAQITNSNQIMLGGDNGSGLYPQVVAPGGIVGATGSFSYLSSTQQISAPGGITGANANLVSVTTSIDSAFNGVRVGLGNGSQPSNTVVGFNCLNSNTTGTDNTAVGINSLNSNTSGYNNTAVGSNSLYLLTTGIANTSIGNSSMMNGVNGSYNTAIGTSTLTKVESQYNTAIGYNSAKANLVNGEYNTLLGANTNVANDPLNYSTAVGYNAQITSSNQIMLGGVNGSGLYPQVVAPGGITGPTGSFYYLSYMFQKIFHYKEE